MGLGDAAAREARRRAMRPKRRSAPPGGTKAETLGSYDDESLEAYASQRTDSSKATFIPGHGYGKKSPGTMSFSNEDLGDEASEARSKWREDWVTGPSKWPKARRNRRFTAKQAGDALAED